MPGRRAHGGQQQPQEPQPYHSVGVVGACVRLLWARRVVAFVETGCAYDRGGGVGGGG